LGCRRQRLLQPEQHELTTAATDFSGAFLPPASAGVRPLSNFGGGATPPLRPPTSAA
jgi:hypothetical protein